MNFNFLNKISFLKLSGISKFICIDIHPEYVKFSCIKRKESLFNISVKNNPGRFEIVAAEFYHASDFRNIIVKTVKDLALKYDFSDAALIAGINDFKFTTASIPADTEEIDSWFYENRNKFLPEGRPADEFAFSYEMYKEDENYKNFMIVIARADFINTIYSSCAATGLKLAGIIPFVLSAAATTEENKNTLLIDFEGQKINYLFRSAGGNIIYRDSYFDTNGQAEADYSYSGRSINTNSLNFFLEELKQTITLSSGTQGSENTDVVLICQSGDYDIFSGQVKKYFEPAAIYTGGSKESLFYTASLFAVQKLVNDFNTTLNLLKDDNAEKEREAFEKQTAFRIILAGGVLLILLLVAAYAGEGYVNNGLESQESVYLETAAKAGNVEKLQKENSHLKSNLALLSKLKGNRVEYSNLLFDITKTINSGSCLTDIKLKENEGYIQVEYTGLSESQQTVAEFMSNMEYSNKFKDISLVYSALLKESRQQVPEELQDEDYVGFKITAKYYADTK